LLEIYEYIREFTNVSNEGESCVVIVGALQDILKSLYGQVLKIETHKVNQSGASSREIGDIDVYKDDVLYYSIEVK